MAENKFCIYCGNKLDEGSKFCGNCGSPIGGEQSQSEKPLESTTEPVVHNYADVQGEGTSAQADEPRETKSEVRGDRANAPVSDGAAKESRRDKKARKKALKQQKKQAKKNGKKKGGCLKKILMAILLIVGAFILLAILLPAPENNMPPANLTLVDDNDGDVQNGSGMDPSGIEDNSNPQTGSGDAAGATDSTGQIGSTDMKEYTFMVFLNGSNLESGGGYATADIAEMASTGSTDAVNIIIETGGTSGWQNDIVDPAQSQRYKVEKDGLDLLHAQGIQNMGAPETLTDFIVWTVQNYPAEKYVLDLWDHGGGPMYGYGSDENFLIGPPKDPYGDYLSMAELRKALSDAYDITGVKFEILGFDACLMATLEVAEMAGQYANYLVASQEEEPGHGWNYTGIFSALASNPQMNGRQLGTVIADAYQAQAVEYGKEDLITLSVIDLAYIYDVVIALEDLSVDFMINMDDITTFNAISESRNNIEAYGRNNFFSGYTELVDLYDFARKITGPQEYLAEDLMRAIEMAVAYKVEGTERGFTGGLSIFFPYWDKTNLDYNLETYSEINGIDTYEGFLETYTAVMQGDTRSVVLESREPEEIESDVFSIVIADEDVMNIASIYNYLGLMLNEDMTAVMTLGMDTNVNYDPETGIVTDNFSGYWTALNGNIISLNVVEDTAEYNMYNIPAYINGERADIVGKWTFDDSFEEGGYYEVLGAWAVDNDDVMAQKDFFDLEMGDVIEPVFEVLDGDTYEKYEITSDMFTIAEAPYLDYIELPTGEIYLYGFYLIDYAQNGEFSSFEIFDYVD